MLLKDKLVFVVEDNLQNRVIFQMLLIRQGARVEFERRGRDAIYRLQTLRHVDIVIMDLALADGISGYDLFRQIRALEGFEQVPVVAVSATDPAIGIPRTQMMGFNGFIAKPLDDVQFPRQIARVLEGHSVWETGIVLE
ncbi:MAG: response regulator [Anaerolineae bacterium]